MKNILPKAIIVLLTLLVIVSPLTSCNIIKKFISKSDNTSTKTNNSNSKLDYTVGKAHVTTTRSPYSSKTKINVSVAITNTGTSNILLNQGSIEFENAEGKIEHTINSVYAYPPLIQPGETAYYCEFTYYDGIYSDDIKVVPVINAVKTNSALPKLKVSDHQMKDSSIGAKVVGRVENTSGKRQTKMYVVAGFFDEEGNMIGREFDYFEGSFPVGYKIAFETTSADYNTSEISYYEVFAFPSEFD